MALSLAQLLTPSSEDESLAAIIAILDGFGFTASSWQSGSIQRTLIQVLARLHSDASNTVYALTSGRFNDLAVGDWLTLKSKSDFDNDRIPAVATQALYTISDPNSLAGPQTFIASQLVTKDQNSFTYRNIDGGTMILGGSVTLTFQAEVPGASSFPTSMTLVTPVAGTVSAMPVSGAIVLVGADAESDDRLRVRNSTKWAALSYASPKDAYIFWSLSASAAVTRAYVDDLNPRGPGTIDLYVAGPTGPVDPSVLVDVMDYLNGVTDGIYRRPIGSDVECFSAVSGTVSITGTLYVNASFDLTQTNTAVSDAIDTYFEALPVGGTVQLAKLYQTIMEVTGVSNVHLTAPTVDTTVAANAAPVASTSLTAMVG